MMDPNTHLSTRRIEHGMPLLVDFDLGALVGAHEKFQSGDPSGMTELAQVMAHAGKSRVARKLSAVVRATEDQLRDAEMGAGVMAALEEEAAMRPYTESFKDALGFFSAWGQSLKGSPGSSGGQ